MHCRIASCVLHIACCMLRWCKIPLMLWIIGNLEILEEKSSILASPKVIFKFHFRTDCTMEELTERPLCISLSRVVFQVPCLILCQLPCLHLCLPMVLPTSICLVNNIVTTKPEEWATLLAVRSRFLYVDIYIKCGIFFKKNIFGLLYLLQVYLTCWNELDSMYNKVCYFLVFWKL